MKLQQRRMTTESEEMLFERLMDTEHALVDATEDFLLNNADPDEGVCLGCIQKLRDVYECFADARAEWYEAEDPAHRSSTSQFYFQKEQQMEKHQTVTEHERVKMEDLEHRLDGLAKEIFDMANEALELKPEERENFNRQLVRSLAASAGHYAFELHGKPGELVDLAKNALTKGFEKAFEIEHEFPCAQE